MGFFRITFPKAKKNLKRKEVTKIIVAVVLSVGLFMVMIPFLYAFTFSLLVHEPSEEEYADMQVQIEERFAEYESALGEKIVEKTVSFGHPDYSISDGIYFCQAGNFRCVLNNGYTFSAKIEMYVKGKDYLTYIDEIRFENKNTGDLATKFKDCKWMEPIVSIYAGVMLDLQPIIDNLVFQLLKEPAASCETRIEDKSLHITFYDPFNYCGLLFKKIQDS